MYIYIYIYIYLTYTYITIYRVYAILYDNPSQWAGAARPLGGRASIIVVHECIYLYIIFISITTITFTTTIIIIIINDTIMCLL